jgi:hypothetical protein
MAYNLSLEDKEVYDHMNGKARKNVMKSACSEEWTITFDERI